MIAVSEVSHHFPHDGGRLEVVDQVSFEVARPEVVSIVGPTGCGKSTLLKILGGLIAPSEGMVDYDGDAVSASLGGQCFGFVFQKPTLLPWRTALQNVSLPLEIISSDHAEDPLTVLASVGLKGFENSLPAQLSGGMEQRVALARALVHRPRVLFMDEPFAAVDEITRAELNNLLIALTRERELTVFFVTHSISEAVYLSDRVLVMSSRPTQIKETVVIDLPNRGDLSLKESPEFQSKVRWIREALGR